jgi:magnesium chelatase family protein
MRAHMFPVTALAAAADDEESTATVRERVLAAREAAAQRWAGQGWRTNAEVPGPVLRTRFALPAARCGRSRQPCDRASSPPRRRPALRVAWTLA